MGFMIDKSGPLTTIQDSGRAGYQNMGFHVCGIMDRQAFLTANYLVDRTDKDPVLEFTIMGPTLHFTEDTIISITGGDFEPKINGEPAPMYTAIEVHKDDELAMGFCKSGTWGYLAFAGRLDIPAVMGAAATDMKCHLGGFEGRKLMDGDRIEFAAERKRLPNMAARHTEKISFGAEETEVRVILGPQDDYFTVEGIQTFLNSPYMVTHQCDRMGYRLEGAAIEHNEKGADIISDGIAMGSIQVPAHGQPIIMLADRQTTGGYTKIANVISADIPALVQCRYPQKIRFRAVSVEEAQKIAAAQSECFERMKEGWSRKSFFVRLFGKITGKKLSR